MASWHRGIVASWHRGDYLWVLEPYLDGPLHDGCVGGVDPVEEHHVGGLRVEGECDAPEVAGQADHGLANLL